MKKINVLIIDDNESVTSSIKSYFSSHAVIKVVDSATNGKEGLEKIIANHWKYDLIIMDLILGEIDGLELLHQMKLNKISKKVIVISGYKEEYTLKLTNEYGVSYFMLKPFKLDVLERRIIDIFQIDDHVNDNLKVEISKLLHALGVPSHVKGYEYIREGISIMYEEPNNLRRITKEIYPRIARQFSTTSSRVERAIRHAIEISWARGDYELMEKIFGNSLDFEKAKPTNSEFLATLVDKLRLDTKYRNIVTI